MENVIDKQITTTEKKVNIHGIYKKPNLGVMGKSTYIITMCKQGPCNGKGGGGGNSIVMC